MLSNCTPPRNRMIQTVEAQPAIALPISTSTIAQMMPIKPIRQVIRPSKTISVSGLTDRLVMPSIAKEIIFPSDAVKSQRQHLLKRIVAFTGHPFMPFVIDRAAFKAHKREHAAQKDVDLLKVGKMPEHFGAYQTVIRMVINHFDAHLVHEPIKGQRARPFEPTVAYTAAADAVDDITAFLVFLDHAVHCVQIVLPVAVDRDRNIAVFLCLHKTGQKRVLVPTVPALRNAEDMLVSLRKLTDDVPGHISGSVVHK